MTNKRKFPKINLPKSLADKYRVVADLPQRTILHPHGEINFSTITEARIHQLIKKGFKGIEVVEQKKSTKTKD